MQHEVILTGRQIVSLTSRMGIDFCLEEWLVFSNYYKKDGRRHYFGAARCLSEKEDERCPTDEQINATRAQRKPMIDDR